MEGEIAFKNEQAGVRSWPPSELCWSFCRCGSPQPHAVEVMIHSNHCSPTVYQLLIWGERLWKMWWVASLEICQKRGDRRSERRTRCSGIYRIEKCTTWCGQVQRKWHFLLGNRNVVLLALDPQECSHTQIYPLCCEICVLHTLFIQLRKAISCNKNNSINNNSQYILSSYYLRDYCKYFAYILAHWFFMTSL